MLVLHQPITSMSVFHQPITAMSVFHQHSGHSGGLSALLKSPEINISRTIIITTITYSESDVISFQVYDSWFPPPCCGYKSGLLLCYRFVSMSLIIRTFSKSTDSILLDYLNKSSPVNFTHQHQQHRVIGNDVYDSILAHN